MNCIMRTKMENEYQNETENVEMHRARGQENSKFAASEGDLAVEMNERMQEGRKEWKK